MKQIVQSAKTGRLEVKQVPAPGVSPGHILVKTETSLISAGTERMAVAFAKKSLAGKARARPDLVGKVIEKVRRDGLRAAYRSVMSRLDEPLPLGYSAAGRVIAVGAGLEGNFRVGERVAIAGAGLANHAEINAIPRQLAASIPDGVAAEDACYATLGSIALHAVRNLDAGLGDVVAVIGVGLVGQLAAQFLRLQGARVVAIDTNAARLDLATRLGAEAAFDAAGDGLAEAIGELTRGLGCDRILLAAATESAEPLATAAAIARDRAKICMVGLSGTEFPYADFMKKELSLVVSRSYGPGRYDEDYETRGVKYPPGFVRWTETENLGECLRLMAPSSAPRLDVSALTTHRFAIEEAGAAYDLVTGGGDTLGVVLTYGGGDEADDKIAAFPKPAPSAAKSKPGTCVLGVIGAGNFARAVLLPELRRLGGVELRTLVTKRGVSAENTKEKFGFAHAATDAEVVFADPQITAVIIATRHDSHARLTQAALAAGKPVLVEKPLGLSRAEIEAVAGQRRDSDAFFQIGFNRRFAPMSIRLRDHLARHAGPKFLLLRVNAGAIPADSWIQSGDEGGGRILGEVCHFIDLARFFIGQPIISVMADAAGAGAGPLEDIGATLRFADGSLATLAYTALGDGAYPKERFEAYVGGTVAVIENFDNLTLTEGGRISASAAGARDKGFHGALKAFTEAAAKGGPAPVDETELIETSLATVAVMESLQSGARIDL